MEKYEGGCHSEWVATVGGGCHAGGGLVRASGGLVRAKRNTYKKKLTSKMYLKKKVRIKF